MVDARLPDGSRVNVVIPPLALDGPALTIRRFAGEPLTGDDLVELGTIDDAMLDLLRAAVRARRNLLVTGGTGSGKTTTLAALAAFVPPRERLVTIEDAAELRIPLPHVVRLESRPASLEGAGAVSIRALVRNALRMRPDRIVVGEVRGGEALDMLTAMTTGHEGSLSTLHASSPADAIRRVQTLALMGDLDLPYRAVADQVASALDVVVHQARLADGRRRVVEIAAVAASTEGPRLTSLVRWMPGAGGAPRFEWSAAAMPWMAAAAADADLATPRERGRRRRGGRRSAVLSVIGLGRLVERRLPAPPARARRAGPLADVPSGGGWHPACGARGSPLDRMRSRPRGRSPRRALRPSVRALRTPVAAAVAAAGSLAPRPQWCARPIAGTSRASRLSCRGSPSSWRRPCRPGCRCVRR